MNPSLSLLAFLVLTSAMAQEPRRELALWIVVDKETFTPNEPVFVKAELTNTSTETLCFPEPAQECSVPAVGWVVTTGEPVPKSDDSDQFICHIDARGKTGAELESAIAHEWIKLPPNAVYRTKRAKALVNLGKAGQFRLASTYHPPEGSFSREYTNVLQSAAKNGRDCPCLRYAFPLLF